MYSFNIRPDLWPILITRTINKVWKYFESAWCKRRVFDVMGDIIRSATNLVHFTDLALQPMSTKASLLSRDTILWYRKGCDMAASYVFFDILIIEITIGSVVLSASGCNRHLASQFYDIPLSNWDRKCLICAMVMSREPCFTTAIFERIQSVMRSRRVRISTYLVSRPDSITGYSLQQCVSRRS